jgi:hypothetical protein
MHRAGNGFCFIGMMRALTVHSLHSTMRLISQGRRPELYQSIPRDFGEYVGNKKDPYH